MKAGIVEDQVIYQRYLAGILEDVLGFDVVVKSIDGEDALEQCIANQVEFLLLDLKIPKVHGLELAEQLLNELPHLKVLAFSGEINAYNLRMIQSLGVLGYLDKSDPTIEDDAYMAKAISNVARGVRTYSPSVEALAKELSSDQDSFYKVLTPKKIEILKLIARCMTDDEIANEIQLSTHTIRKHRNEMLQHLNIETTWGLIRYAQKNGFASFTQDEE